MKQKIIFKIDGIDYLITPITATKYCNLVEKSIFINRDYYGLMELDFYLDSKFNFSHLYAALKINFGESSTLFDDWKCSFGYPFLIEVKDNNLSYVFLFTDIKGGIYFNYYKILSKPKDRKKYNDLSLIYDSPDDLFDVRRIRIINKSFMSFLKNTNRDDFNEEFIRSNRELMTIYGYKDGSYFIKQYEFIEKFEKEISRYIL
jgi:hypothetical protein